MSDEEGLCVRAFHVDGNALNDELDNYELHLPPTSGVEFLKRVQHEAKQCPDVVVADLDLGTLNRKQTVVVDSSNGCLPAPSGYKPSLEWQRHQVADFSQVRQNLVKYKLACKKKKVKKSSLPSSENADSWYRLCFGAQSEDSNTCGSPPLLSLVANMDQVTVNRVLEHHIDWFDKHGFSQQQGRWFYALLCCLEKPLTPEACSLLRRLARSCCCVRAALDSEEDEILPALNLFICLVARYFGQMDLGDVS